MARKHLNVQGLKEKRVGNTDSAHEGPDDLLMS